MYPKYPVPQLYTVDVTLPSPPIVDGSKSNVLTSDIRDVQAAEKSSEEIAVLLKGIAWAVSVENRTNTATPPPMPASRKHHFMVITVVGPGSLAGGIAPSSLREQCYTERWSALVQVKGLASLVWMLLGSGRTMRSLVRQFLS